MKKALLGIFSFSFFCGSVYAQPFAVKNSGDARSFRELQRQFNAWKKNTDLNEAKNWKNFKRWEADMTLHTGANGEPVDPTEYFDAAVSVAQEKESRSRSQFSSAWYPAGPNAIPNNLTGYMENGIGRINCIAFDPAVASTYYVGVAQGGLWKTTNNGTSWTPLTDNLPITRISDICIDPNNTNTIYISVCDFEYIGFGLYLNGRKRHTHYGLGVYKSTDGGTTWQPTGLSFQLTDGDASLIRKVLVDPGNSNTLVACGVSGMYRSTDAGANWNMVMDSLMWDMVQDPVNPSTLYAASGWVYNANDGYAAIYKSTDFGSSWTMLNTGIPGTGTVQRIKLGIAPSDNTKIYAVTVNMQSGLHGIYKSSNSGNTWQFVNPSENVLDGGQGQGSGGQGTYDLGFMIHPTNSDILYVGGVNLWGSSDGGQNWDPASYWTLDYGPTVHGDIHFIERQPLTGNIFLVSDGGVYRTTSISTITWNDANNNIPWPTIWTNLSDGMQVTSFYRLSSSKNSAGRLLAGAQDNASLYFDGTSWFTIFGGDGMDNYLDPVDNNAGIGSSQYGYFYYTNDGGVSGSSIDPNYNFENAEWVSPIAADYNNYGTLYAGFENVSQSTDGGASWQYISNFPSPLYGNEVVALAVSNSNSSVIYAGRRVRYEYGVPGSVFNTTDGGANWTDVTAGLPDSLYYTGIEISEFDANRAYVCMAGFSAGNKVFMTTNGGSSWTNISYNLPNIPVNCIRYIPGSGGDIVIATDLGIYELDFSSTTWVNQSLGLPNVICSDIEFNTALNKVYISTFGRGIWANDIGMFTSNQTVYSPETAIELFPTVNDGSFTIRIPENTNVKGTVQFDVIDVTGKIAHSVSFADQKVTNHRLRLAPGIYYARLTGEGISGVQRFIVQ
ncbi:MAG: glycosyl hydrolase BNR repeat-containing protein [Bacteroidetes bacterium]|nr:MAG: glycosyl hydrolase BNR repeat-containing protein [Bacteroidota bacterium]